MKKVPFTKKQIIKLCSKYPTPFYIYDEEAIRKNVLKFIGAFSWVDNFKEYFAVKACPNPHILKILKEEGCGADCSSLGELILSEKVNITGENIMFTSNDTPLVDYFKAKELGAIINFDDITQISYFLKNVGRIEGVISCRYNPGPLKMGNSIMGNPEDAKYGMTREQIFEAYKILRDSGITKFGLHTMVASNELNPQYFIETAKILFELIIEIEKELNITFDFVNLGGGIGIPYRPKEKEVDYKLISTGIKKVYNQLFINRKKLLNIFMEMGRMITGPYGYLITSVKHTKDTYKKYLGTDASMADLMRPGMYGAYHHITVLDKENENTKTIFDVTGSLCENNDKFAIDRELPSSTKVGDILVIHDVGAHGHSMGFNYNAKLRSAEFLFKKNGGFELIRRAETLDDYFATLDF